MNRPQGVYDAEARRNYGRCAACHVYLALFDSPICRTCAARSAGGTAQSSAGVSGELTRPDPSPASAPSHDYSVEQLPHDPTCGYPATAFAPSCWCERERAERDRQRIVRQAAANLVAKYGADPEDGHFFPEDED